MVASIPPDRRPPTAGPSGLREISGKRRGDVVRVGDDHSQNFSFRAHDVIFDAHRHRNGFRSVHGVNQ